MNSKPNKFILRFLAFMILTAGISVAFIPLEFSHRPPPPNLKQPPQKTILVIGDSHPECAINDGLLPDVFNFSKSGTAYLYTYLKIREYLKQNPQTKTIVLGYDCYSIGKEQDRWIKSNKMLQDKLPIFLSLFDCSTYLTLLRANPPSVICATHRMMLTTKAKERYLGSYIDLKRQKLSEAIEDFEPKKSTQAQTSTYQTDYLLKIYALTESHHVNLILLAIPIHPILSVSEKSPPLFQASFASTYLPNATVIDHTNFPIPEAGYADLSHLNYIGAKIYTEYLLKHGFAPLPPSLTLQQVDTPTPTPLH